MYLNVTVTQPTRNGYVAAYPAGGSSTSSSINFRAGQLIPNLVFVPVGTEGADEGKVTLRNGSPGTVHVIADSAGFVRSGTPAAAGAAAPVAPERVLDTRNDIGVGTTTAVPANRTVTFRVAGRGNIPADGVAGVYLNVTVAQPTTAGYVAAYPAGGSTSGSNLNFRAGQSIANLVFVPLGTGDDEGKGDPAQRQRRHGAPDRRHRRLRARRVRAIPGRGPRSARPGCWTPVPRSACRAGRRCLQAARSRSPFRGRGHLPDNGVAGVFLNVTVTHPTHGGYVAAYPAGGSSSSSNLNFVAGQTIPNLVFVPVGTGATAGRVTLKNGSAGTVHLIADTAGYVADRDIAPRLTGQPDQSSNVGLPFRYRVKVTGGEAPYRISATDLPAGFRITDGVIQGVPTAALASTPVSLVGR